jgi:hypothetical protein
MAATTKTNAIPLRDVPVMQPHEWDVLRSLRGLPNDEYEQVLTLIGSFRRGLDDPPERA